MHKKKNYKDILILAAWLITTVYAAGFSIYNFNLREYWTLTQRGQKIIGVVSEKNAETHNSIKYKYQVEDKTFTGGGYAGDIGKEFLQVNIGEKVYVFYLPDNPSFSCMGDPREIFYSNLRIAMFISLFPSIAVLIYKIKPIIVGKTIASNQFL